MFHTNPTVTKNTSKKNIMLAWETVLNISGIFNTVICKGGHYSLSGTVQVKLGEKKNHTKTHTHIVYKWGTSLDTQETVYKCCLREELSISNKDQNTI